jgi:hypothetical protein
MDQDTLRFLLREAVRETVTEVLQTVLELDRTAFLQAHGGRRNGYYPRRLETTFGQVDLKVPRDREGQYYPAFLKPYARRLVDVGEVAVALYAAGVSQRKAAEVMSLLLGHRYSHETISAMTEEVLQAVEAFRRRPLPEEMAFVYLDGLYLKLLREGEGVVREVVYVALGVTPCGERQVLGYWLLRRRAPWGGRGSWGSCGSGGSGGCCSSSPMGFRVYPKPSNGSTLRRSTRHGGPKERGNKGMRRLLALLLCLLPALAQVFPQGGGRYAYSDGTLQELLPAPEGFRLRYLKGSRLFREDRLKLTPEGLYLLGVGLPEGYFPFAPPLLLYPPRLFPGQAWGGSAAFQGQRVALSARVEGLEGLRTRAGAFRGRGWWSFFASARLEAVAEDLLVHPEAVEKAGEKAALFLLHHLAHPR